MCQAPRQGWPRLGKIHLKKKSTSRIPFENTLGHLEKSLSMDLKNDRELSDSPVVANCRMNRERELTGGNSYARDLGLAPVDFLRARLENRKTVRWLDLCCGRGRALIEAAWDLSDEAERVQITGIDLVGMFDPADLPNLRLIEISIENWIPAGSFDLITCVHGLHYVGDKLGTLAKAVSWLVDDGCLVAHLDQKNLKHDRHSDFGRVAVRHLRESGLTYDSRKRIVRCESRREMESPWLYRGADDTAGPNFTGQPAVDSWYADPAD
jgi:SAM-dependent methyltransferase